MVRSSQREGTREGRPSCCLLRARPLQNSHRQSVPGQAGGKGHQSPCPQTREGSPLRALCRVGRMGFFSPGVVLAFPGSGAGSKPAPFLLSRGWGAESVRTQAHPHPPQEKRTGVLGALSPSTAIPSAPSTARLQPEEEPASPELPQRRRRPWLILKRTPQTFAEYLLRCPGGIFGQEGGPEISGAA